jgi:hypothetical protein
MAFRSSDQKTGVTLRGNNFYTAIKAIIIMVLSVRLIDLASTTSSKQTPSSARARFFVWACVAGFRGFDLWTSAPPKLALKPRIFLSEVFLGVEKVSPEVDGLKVS